ncbi:MAG: hypothetical protein EAZ07_07165 [Cytophagales bacterium]|nr:MAG: hypothetical protein EAZ07_07165 [Cytophagales bacterium]
MKSFSFFLSTVISIVFFAYSSSLASKSESIIFDFEAPIPLSNPDCNNLNCKVEIAPRLYANEVRTSSRVYQILTDASRDKGSLAMIPIATFNPTLDYLASSDLVNKYIKSIKVEFKGNSLKNGGLRDTRYAELFLQYSFDNGKTFEKESKIANFNNENSPIQNYSFEKIIEEAAEDQIIVRLIAKRSIDSSGTCARVVMNDLNFSIQYEESLSADDYFKEDVSFYTYFIIGKNDVLYLNKEFSGEIINNYGKRVLFFDKTKEIDISALTSGVFYLRLSNGLNKKLIYNK